MTGDRGVGALRVAAHGAAAGEGQVLGGQAQERGAVAAPKRAQRGRQVAVERGVVGGVAHHLPQRGAVDLDALERAVGVAGCALDRPGLKSKRPAAQLGEHVLAAAGRAAADLGPGVAQSDRFLAPPRVEAVDREGRVEHDGSHPVRVAHREGLREVGPVRVAVDVRHLDTELVQHGCQIVGGGSRPVGVRATPQAPRAAADLARVDALARLKARAVDRARAPGPAVVHHDQVPARMEAAEHEPVQARRLDRGVAGPALDRDHGLQRRPRAVRSREHPEVDPQPAAAATGGTAEQRHENRAAPRRPIVLAAVEARHRGPRRRCGREAKSQDRQHGPEAHSDREPTGAGRMFRCGCFG